VTEANLLLLDRLGERYGQRPSAFLGLDDAWLAYQVDVAAWEARVRVLDEDTAQHGAFHAPNPALRQSGRRTPGSFKGLGAVRKMKIPENGIW
jgi:hypothetical protein